MKKLLTLFALLSITLITPALASHLRGGEITWACQGNGQYVFYLKLYKDCYNNNTQQLRSTGGGVAVITLFLTTSNELTPPGCGYSCNNPGGFAGVIEEAIFKSNPVTLTGTPPPSGWTFYWDYECCRNTVDNMTGGAQMVLRSIMYPSNGLSADPCYDSSPRFINSPVSAICVGYPFTYNPIAVDNDFDSLSYSFDYPLSSAASGTPYSPMSFSFPYSVSSPLPGNPAINPITGELTLLAAGAVAGNYATCVRVDSYRCGIIIASVFREIQINLSTGGCDGGCDGTGNNQNDPPQTNPAPFKDPVTGFYTVYADTVLVGDTVSFTVNVSEFETLVIDCATPQNFFIDMRGAQMDSGSVAPYINCDSPPCAYIDFPTPAGPFIWGKALIFNWVIDCAHDANNCSEFTPYFFEITAKDDACPTPALNNTTFEIVVQGLRVNRTGDTLFVNAPYANLQWYMNGALIPGATNDTLIAPVIGANYTVQAVAPSGCILNSNGTYVGVNKITTSANNLTLYPNPVSGVLHVEIKSEVAEATQLKITDGLGRELKHEVLQLNPGRNSFDVATNDLQNGIYYLSVKGKDTVYSKRIIVLH